jgi:hypothetical protein
VNGSRPQDGAKSFDIPKRMVWEAYQRVKANKGAPGVDGVTIEQFEQDLKGNLYKLWNRSRPARTSLRRSGAWRSLKQAGKGCVCSGYLPSSTG